MSEVVQNHILHPCQQCFYRFLGFVTVIMIMRKMATIVGMNMIFVVHPVHLFLFSFIDTRITAGNDFRLYKNCDQHGNQNQVDDNAG